MLKTTVTIPVSKLYADVMEFHQAFGHPIAQPSKNQELNRCHWIHEEIIEFATHTALVDEIDALIDLMYFITGYSVELGTNVLHSKDMLELNAIVYYKGHIPIQDYTKQKSEYMHAFLNLSNTLSNITYDTAEENFTDISDLKIILAQFTKEVLFWFPEHSIDFMPFWNIVQEANMAKLWPDGKPHYRKDGKVVKPKGWQPPEPKMEQVLEEMLL